MPLKIHPPRPGSKGPRIRGSHRGPHGPVTVYRTVEVGEGATRAEAQTAAKQLRRELERAIERGELGAPERVGRLTFARAAVAYVKAGGDATFLPRLEAYFGEKLAEEIDQAAVEAAALALYPNAAPATWNRQVYTPIAAVLRHAMPDRALRLKRPKMPKGRVTWLEPEQVGALVAAASGRPPLRALIVFLVYTGCRLGEALELEWERVRLDDAFAWIPVTKTDEPRGVHLPPHVVAELRPLRPVSGKGSVFGYAERWAVYPDLDEALGAAGIVLPARTKAHVFRHTYATWMRRAGYTPFDLVDAGVWRDIRSAMRYQHVAQVDAARGADDLPVPTEIRAQLVQEKRDDEKSTA